MLRTAEVLQPGLEFVFGRGIPPSDAIRQIMQRYLLPEARLPLPVGGKWTDARPNVVKIWGPPGGQVEQVLEEVLGNCRTAGDRIAAYDLADPTTLPGSDAEYTSWRRGLGLNADTPLIVVLRHPEGLNPERWGWERRRLREHLAILRQRLRTLIISASTLDRQRIVDDFSLRRKYIEIRLGGELPVDDNDIAGLYSGGNPDLHRRLSLLIAIRQLDPDTLSRELQVEVGKWIPDRGLKNQALAASTLPGFSYSDLREALAVPDKRARRLTDAQLRAIHARFFDQGLMAGWDRASGQYVWHHAVRTVLQLLVALKHPRQIGFSHAAVAEHYDARRQAANCTATATRSNLAAKVRYHELAAANLQGGDVLQFARFLNRY